MRTLMHKHTLTHSTNNTPHTFLSLPLSLSGQRLGSLFGKNAALYFDNTKNVMNMTGYINPESEALPAVAAMVNKYLTNQPAEVFAIAGPNGKQQQHGHIHSTYIYIYIHTQHINDSHSCRHNSKHTSY